MAHKRGSKYIPEPRAEAIHDMSCVGVQICEIAGYYNMPEVLSNVIRRLGNVSTKRKKKMGHIAWLSEHGICLFLKYVLQYRFAAIFVIFAQFKQATVVSLREKTGRRYIGKLKMQRYLTIQKPYLSTKNISERIVWARTHEHWKQEQWSRVMVADESSCFVRPMRNRLRVWRLLQWTAQNHDLNPIENALAILKRNLRRQSTHPTTKEGLFARLSQVWDSFPDSYLEKLISSMSTRVKDVRRVKGLSTKY